MIEIVWGPRFKRAYKKKLKQYPEMKQQLSTALNLFVKNPYHPLLKTHKTRIMALPHWWIYPDKLLIPQSGEYFNGKFREATYGYDGVFVVFSFPSCTWERLLPAQVQLGHFVIEPDFHARPTLATPPPFWAPLIPSLIPVPLYRQALRFHWAEKADHPLVA